LSVSASGDANSSERLLRAARTPRQATDRQLHVYAVAQANQWVSRDVLRVEEGALYPAVPCLEVRGLVRSAWGVSDNNRRAKFYTPTAAGRLELARETESWTRVATAIGRVMQTAQGRSMRPLQAFGRRLLALFRRQRLEQDLEDELAFHLAMRAADHRDAGLPPDSAGAAARRQFGSVTLLKEQARAVWPFPSVADVLQDT